jgi:hypothetical protein
MNTPKANKQPKIDNLSAFAAIKLIEIPVYKDGYLIFKLNNRVNSDWIFEFQCRKTVYEIPNLITLSSFLFDNDIAKLHMSPSDYKLLDAYIFQKIVDMFKDYLTSANLLYAEMLEQKQLDDEDDKQGQRQEEIEIGEKRNLFRNTKI